jgi:hypothetical protein
METFDEIRKEIAKIKETLQKIEEEGLVLTEEKIKEE